MRASASWVRGSDLAVTVSGNAARSASATQVDKLRGVSRPKVEPATELTPAQKLLLSLDMFEYGRDMMRQNLRRTHPCADAATIDALLLAWLRTRPGAELGDGEGRSVTWPRKPGCGDA